jgi:hypothetical protein
LEVNIPEWFTPEAIKSWHINGDIRKPLKTEVIKAGLERSHLLRRKQNTQKMTSNTSVGEK